MYTVQDLASLQQLNKVATAEIKEDGRVVVIQLKDLWVHSVERDWKAKICDYKVSIPYEPRLKEGDSKLLSFTKVGAGLGHPHIGLHTHPCAGGYLVHLYDDVPLFNRVQVILQFLSSSYKESFFIKPFNYDWVPVDPNSFNINTRPDLVFENRVSSYEIGAEVFGIDDDPLWYDPFDHEPTVSHKRSLWNRIRGRY